MPQMQPLRTGLPAWECLGMLPKACDAGEDAAIEGFQGRRQRGRMAGEEFGAPLGEVGARVSALPLLKELLGFGGAARLLQSQGAEEVAGALPFCARRDSQDLVQRLAGGVRVFPGELALGREQVFEPFVNVNGIGLTGTEVLRPLPGGGDQTQRVVERAGLETLNGP